MHEGKPFAEIVTALARDAAYRDAFTARLSDRTVDEDIVAQLIGYARSRQTTMGQAMARRVLTAAGVSWEAV